MEDEQGWLQLPDGQRQQLTLPDFDPQAVADGLDGLDPHTDPEPPEVPAEDPDAPPPAPVDIAAPAPVDPAWCEVRLLGPMQATRNGQPIEYLTPIARQLLAYLATHRDGVTLERLDDTIWPGHTPSHRGQRARTALTRLRRSLGDGPDGQPLLPRRADGDDKIRLSPDVGTDLDRAFGHLATAQHLEATLQVEQLCAALQLIRGEPFEDLPVSWSIDIRQRAIAQLQEAALTASVMLRDTGRYDHAEQTIRQGLKLCDPCEPLYIE